MSHARSIYRKKHKNVHKFQNKNIWVQYKRTTKTWRNYIFHRKMMYIDHDYVI